MRLSSLSTPLPNNSLHCQINFCGIAQSLKNHRCHRHAARPCKCSIDPQPNRQPTRQLRIWSIISSAFGSSDLGALRRYKSLMWLGHTARFAPSSLSDLIGKLLIYKNNYKFTQLRKSLKINLLYLQVRQAASIASQL